MAVVNGYATLDALKARVKVADPGDDALLESAIVAASRSIDLWTGRRFYAATETRYLTPTRGDWLALDADLLSVTTLKTDEDGDRTYEITWSSSLDYYLLPDNAAADGRPYTHIALDGYAGRYAFPCRHRAVEIVGSWGYCTAATQPAVIAEACLRLAERLWKLPSAPLGVAGTPEMGMVRIGQDRDLNGLLWPYNRRRGFA